MPNQLLHLIFLLFPSHHIVCQTYSELSDAVVKGNLSESKNFQFGTNGNPQAEVERLYVSAPKFYEYFDWLV